MIRKSHLLLAFALALAAAAIGVPVAQAAVKSPYEFLGHPTSPGGVDRVSAAEVSATAAAIASGASPKTPNKAQVFSRGTALAEYQRQQHSSAVTGETQIFSLGTALERYRQSAASGVGPTGRTTSAASFDGGDAVKSPYEYLGHPSPGGVDRVSAAAVSATAVKSPYEFLGHPTSPGGVDRVSAAAGRPIDPLAASTSSPQAAGSTVFQWGDAGIGAGFTLGIVLILAGAGAGLLITRRNRHQQSHA